jgi:FkbM family methyltransferase
VIAAWRRCPFPADARTRAGALLKHAAIHAAIPLVRARVRYGPRGPRAAAFWSRVAEPYFAWHWHGFVARTSFGSRLAGDTREVLQQHVYYFGEWEPDLTSWVAGTLREGDVCVDVGANIGYFSLLAARLVGRSGAVVAIEPSPAAHELLRDNLRRNGADNVRTVEVAAAETRGTLSLFAGHETHTGIATVVEDKGMGVESEVSAFPLSSIVTAAEMERARVIKVDAEGAEWAVVAGMESLWDAARDDLEVVVEVHPEPMEKTGRSVDDLVELFAERGFAARRLAIDYSAEAYLSNGRVRPEPAEGPVDRHTHLVFSRRGGPLR